MKEDYKDIFRRHFDAHHDDTDPLEMWEAIKVRRPRRRRRRRIGLIIIPVVIGVGFLITVAISKIQTKYSENAAVEVSQVEEEMVQIEDVERFDAQGKYESAANELKKEGLAQGKNLQESPNKNLTKVQENTMKAISEDHGLAGLNSSKNSAIKPNNQKPVVESQAKMGNGLPTTEERVEIQTDITASNITQETADFGSMVMNVEMASEETDENSALVKNKNIELIRRLDALMFNPFQSKNSMPSLTMKTEGVIVDQVKQTISAEDKFSIILGGSYGLLSSNFKGVDSSSDALAMKRSSTESNLEAISANLLLDYRVHKSISLSSGVIYTRINELFEWQNTRVRSMIGEHQTGIEVYPGGQVNNVFSVGEYETAVTKKMKIYNKTDLLAIPLTVNLNKTVGNFNFSVSGGMQANILMGERGYVLASDDEVMVLGTEVASKFGLGWSTGVGLEYLVSEKIGLGGNISYNRLNKEQANVNVAYGIVNLGIGLRYKI